MTSGLLFAGLESAVALDTSFFLLEGSHVNLWMPRESVGVNFTKPLVEFESEKVCDAGYDILNEVTGNVPYGGVDINITGYGYDGAQNKPYWAAMGGNPIRIIYDRLSSDNYIVGYTSEDGNNTRPNFGLYFHELWHDFTPRAFTNLFPSTKYNEGFALFMGSFVSRLIIRNYQSFNLNSNNVQIMNNSENYVLDYFRRLDPSKLNMSYSWAQNEAFGAFLQKVSDNYGDGGKAAFTSFFKKLNETLQVIDYAPTNEKECDTLLIALINTATDSDFSTDFARCRFNIDDALYHVYMARLKALADPPVSWVGRVYDFYKNTPNVSINFSSYLNTGFTTTNESGIFSIENLRPGVYTFLFSKDGYATICRRVQVWVPSNASSFIILPGFKFPIETQVTGNFTNILISLVNPLMNRTAPYVTVSADEAQQTLTFRLIVTTYSGGSGSNTGFVNVTIPKTSVFDRSAVRVYLNETLPQESSISQDSENFYVCFTVPGGNCQPTIVFSNTAIPEFTWSPILTLCLLFIIATTVLARRSKRIN